jgi:hypothetical protein
MFAAVPETSGASRRKNAAVRDSNAMSNKTAKHSARSTAS